MSGKLQKWAVSFENASKDSKTRSRGLEGLTVGEDALKHVVKL
jgi:hypothetical protein